MGNIPAQRITFSLSSVKSATVTSRGHIAAVVLPERMASVLLRAFNIRNLGYGSTGGHLFPRRRR